MTRFAQETRWGATLLGPGRTRFRLWAPDCATVGLEVAGRAPQPMQAVGDGWFRGGGGRSAPERNTRFRVLARTLGARSGLSLQAGRRA